MDVDNTISAKQLWGKSTKDLAELALWEIQNKTLVFFASDLFMGTYQKVHVESQFTNEWKAVSFLWKDRWI